MIAAVIVLAIALAAAAGAVVVLGRGQADAERRGGDARAELASRAAELAIARTSMETLRGRANAEKRRADALDDLLSDLNRSGPLDGAASRVLSRWLAGRANATGGAGSGAVLAPPATVATPGSDGLLRPGESG